MTEQPKMSAESPEDVARAFLNAVGARDFDTARGLLAPGAQLVFPGASFTTLEELAAWARPRYRRVAKRIERVDTAAGPDGDVVVVQGALFGEWPQGDAFDDIRFIDWFLIRDGRIVSQRVWNDLAIARR